MEFLATLKSYLLNIGDTWWNLYFPLLMLFGFCVIVLIFALIQCNKKRGHINLNSVNQNLRTSIYWSGLISIFISLVVVISLLRYTSFFATIEGHCQFGVLIGFIALIVFTMMPYARSRVKIKKRDIAEPDMPLSSSAMHRKYLRWLKTMGIRIVSFVIMAGSPFLLLLIPSHRISLVSIVLDNSSSMESALDYCKTSLQDVLYNSPHHGQYILTTLSAGKHPATNSPEDYIQDIVNGDIDELPVQTVVYEGTEDLIAAVSNVKVDEYSGSPILQAIWSNFVTAQNSIHNKVKKKTMIVVSDGMDDAYGRCQVRALNVDILEQEGKGLSPFEFYDGGIYGINVGTSEDFLWGDCSLAELRNGMDYQSYVEAFSEYLPEFFFDWILLYSLVGLLLIGLITLLIMRYTIS